MYSKLSLIFTCYLLHSITVMVVHCDTPRWLTVPIHTESFPCREQTNERSCLPSWGKFQPLDEAEWYHKLTKKCITAFQTARSVVRVPCGGTALVRRLLVAFLLARGQRQTVVRTRFCPHAPCRERTRNSSERSCICRGSFVRTIEPWVRYRSGVCIFFCFVCVQT